MLLNITVDMRFENLDDDALAKIVSAIREDQKRRFMNTWEQYPKIEDLSSFQTAQGTKRYRETYGVSLSQAYWLYNRDYGS